MVSKFVSVPAYIEDLIYTNQQSAKYPHIFAKMQWQKLLDEGDTNKLTFAAYAVSVRDEKKATLTVINRALADAYLTEACADDLVDYCKITGIRTWLARSEDAYYVEQGVRYGPGNPSELELLWDSTELVLTEEDNLSVQTDFVSDNSMSLVDDYAGALPPKCSCEDVI